MLDADIKSQLAPVFAKLTTPVTLRVYASEHADQAALVEMVNELASISTMIQVHMDDTRSAAPSFDVQGGQGTGRITFRGIPGGHEFTSLVLAILHRGGQGKQPDVGVVARMRRIGGPIRLRTYVSLTCENCPEVVQALNLIATHYPDFSHETVDGGVAQDEVEALGIQGVPSVMLDGKLLHSGKIDLAGLLAKLEATFGRNDNASDDDALKSQDLGEFDVAVIGGGPAGASSAIYSVRKGLKTALIAERLGGQLQETKGIENMISMRYTDGAKLSSELTDHVGQYPVQVFEHRRVKSISDGPIKRIELESGEVLQAKAVIVATGATWRQLNIPGEKEHIGNGVAFCAHCDGPFYKAKKVAVVGGGNSGVEAAIDLAAIAEHVTLLEYADQLKADGVLVDKLHALPNVKVITGVQSTRVIGDGRKVTGLDYKVLATQAQETVGVDGVFVQIGLSPNSQFVRNLVDMAPSGEILTDPKGRTSAPGVYAAGDVTTTPFKQIVIAMGEGAKVALTVFEDRLHA